MMNLLQEGVDGPDGDCGEQVGEVGPKVKFQNVHQEIEEYQRTVCG